MQITITTDPVVVDPVITALNQQSNAGSPNPPSDLVFITSLINDFIMAQVSSYNQQQVNAAVAQLSSVNPGTLLPQLKALEQTDGTTPAITKPNT